MRFVIDTNILLSALIKDSTTRKIIVKSGWNFYYPEMSFHEVRKYKELVLKKSGMDEADYNKLLDLLLEHINIVPDERIMNNLEKAKEVIAHIDPDDVVFIATKFSISDSIIWSDDSDFDKQDEVMVLKSEKIVKLFDSLSE
jgi:predicted nucleic acid-binding protein